ncbi:universal stress protein [Dactylosporangium aurantiacum]|uniref:Universal stress protein n=1 Tax=Dactylosporangium aurantiacum TaxID=35754 RepID=A0A9Q9M9Y3_9ACTN|nr:universal stress protein [Dactylosporangium aurantiacum]MDG6107249.1 universal stress protein [Dactylosporangium aurantiacum]UWZ51218.1 universal stress protein [Dactylosporangium aurantiacum]
MLVGYDGSPSASTAVDAGSRLLPGAHAVIVHLWSPPFADAGLRERLWTGPRNFKTFVDAVEREGQREAERLAEVGVRLTEAAGWTAEHLTRRTYGGEGVQLAQIAEETHADVILVGSHGLRGSRALLGSVSDMVVHFGACPIIVVPHPLLLAEYTALREGAVLVGWDGSANAAVAWRSARELFAGRPFVAATAGGDGVVRVVQDPAGPDDPLHAPGRPAEHARRVRPRTVAKALLTYARTSGAAMVVVGSHGRSAAQEVLLGSAARAVLHSADRPVMVVPPPDSSTP